MISERIKKYLQSLSNDDLGLIVNDLNNWKIPKILRNKIPILWLLYPKDGLNPVGKYSFQLFLHKKYLRPIGEYGHLLLGNKESSRYWNTKYRTFERMTNDEFEKWWYSKDNLTWEDKC